MRVLIDECAPRALKNFLNRRNHESLTVQEAGWAGKQNDELLTLVEAEFDVLVSLDTNLTYQQNLAGHRIAIVVLHCSSNRLDHLRQHFPACASAVVIGCAVRSVLRAPRSTALLESTSEVHPSPRKI